MKKRKFFYLFLNVLFFVFIIIFLLSQKNNELKYNSIGTWNINIFQNNNLENCENDFVEKVYDGDTIFGEKFWKIRILWIDAPEIYHPWWTKVKSYKDYGCGQQAKLYADKYLYHKNIKVCFDKNSDKTWWYGRILAYIYFLSWQNYEDFWQMMVKIWYAKVYRSANFKKKKIYLKYEKQAKQAKLWVWSEQCKQEDSEFKKKYLSPDSK